MKKKNNLLAKAALTLLVMLCSLGAGAQETLTVYEGTTTKTYIPMYIYYFDDFTRSQYVIPAADLAVMNGGEIRAITYYTSFTGTYTTDSEVDIYLKEVDGTSISDFVDKSTATIVYQGKVDFVLVDGGCRATITFTTPYNYIGGNLLIGCDNTTDKGWKQINFYGQTVNGASVAGYNSNSLTNVSANQCNFIPKTTFTYDLDDPACPKPTNMTVSDVTTHTATVAWESNFTRFNLQYKAFTTDVWTEVKGLTAKSYILTNLNPGASYQVQVQAIGNDLESKWAKASFTTTASTMTAPTALNCTGVTGNSATLAWTKNGDESAWQICLDGDEAHPVNVTENPYTFTNLTSEHVYTARVRAINGTGDDWSPWSDAVSFMPTNRITIGSGSNVVYGGFPTQSGYKYTFSQQLYTPEQLGTTPCTFQSIDFFSTDGSTTPRKLDVYMVQTDQTSFVADPWRDWVPVTVDNLVFSGEVTFVGGDWTLINFDTPFAYDGTKNVCVVVHDHTGIAGYNGQYMTFKTNSTISSYGTYQSMYTAGNNDYDVKDLTNFSGSSRSRTNNYIRLLKGDYPTCERPATVSVGSITPYAATVTWEGGGTQWNLQYKLADADEWTTVNGLTAKTYTLNSLTPEATYYVGVQTVCGGGDLSLWRRAEFTTTEVTPTPSSLECTGFTAGTATIKWTENGEATAWQVCLNNDETKLINANSNPFKITGLTENAIYNIKVRATSGGLHSHWTDAVSVQPTDKLCLGTASGMVRDGSSHTRLPMDFQSRNSLSQQLYTAAELGSTPCSFTSVDFYLKSDINLKRNIDIYMVLTDKSSFSISTDWVSFSQEDLVFSGEVQTLEYAWTSIAFDSPFMYDGQHNVAIIVHDKNGSAHSANSWATYSTGDNYQALYATNSYEIDLTTLASLYGNTVKQKNQIRLGKGAYNTCQKPTAITVSNITATGAAISWMSDGTAWDVMLDGTVIATGITSQSYALTGLEMASLHEVQVRTNCGSGSVSPWSNAVSFNTILCNDVDKCLVSYELTNSYSYSSTWYGNAIQVIDALTGELLDSWTITEGTTASGTLAVCNGRQIQFKWKENSGSERCVYSVYDKNGDLIFSGTGPLNTPVNHTVDCTSYLPKPVDLASMRSVIPKATLTWTEKGTATKWEICLDNDEANLIVANTTPYTIAGLTTEKFITAKVRAVNGNERSRWSDEITFEETLTTPIGSGTATSYHLPLNNYYKYSLSEQIYTAAELGSEAKSIETIAFYNTYTDVERSMDIYMVATEKEKFTSNNDWVTVTAGDLVYHGTKTFATNGWTTITFDSPFEYDGTSNVLLVVDDNTGSSGSTAYFYNYNDNDYRALSYCSSYTNLDPKLSLSDYSANRWNVKNQIRLLMNEPAAVPKPARFYAPTVYNHSAWLRWVEMGSATSWQLSVSGGSFGEETIINTTKTPYLLEGLKPETDYTVKVRSVSGIEYSRWAGPFTFTTEANEAPWGFGAEQIGPNSAVLSWYDEDIITAWQICVNGDENNLINVTENTYTLTNLTPETEYTLKVRGVIPDESCPWSDELVFTTTEVNPVPRDIEIASAHTTATVKWLGFSDSYNVQYRTAPGITNPIYCEDFEGDSMEGKLENCITGTGIETEGLSAHTGARGFMFFYTENPPQYLISPELTGVTEDMRLQFYYKNYSSTYEETFQVGFSTTTKETSAFNFGDEMTVSDTKWHLYSGDIPAGTKYICLKHTSYDQYYLFIDDIIVGKETAAGEWQTTSTNEATATVTGLTAGTNYELQVRGVVGEAASAWSPSAPFTTQSGSTKIFFADGNWNDADNWEPLGVPTATDDVHIMAAATIPSGFVATARKITVEGYNVGGGGGGAAARSLTRTVSSPSITIKDGGQLRHNTVELPVIVEKNITGYGSGTGGYRLLANPLSENWFSLDPEEVGMLVGSHDLYQFRAKPDDGLEWRNYEREPFSLSPNNEGGYLYANSANQTLTFTGLTGPTVGEWTSSVVVNDGDVTPFTNGWRIFANTAVSNAYVNYGTLDEDWNLTPVDCNFYKLNAAGNGFDLYKNYVEVAPGEAVFVEASASGNIFCKYEPLYEYEPVAVAGADVPIALPRHGRTTHQDANPSAFILGDVNGDGKVTITDATLVMDYVNGNTPEGFIVAAADMNGDGNITVTDTILLLDEVLTKP